MFSESCALDHPSSYWQPVFCVLSKHSEAGWARVVEAVKGGRGGPRRIGATTATVAQRLPIARGSGSVGLDKDMFADLFDGADPTLRLAADLAELLRRFAAGEFDLVGIGRMQIANPDFVAKLASGGLDALRLHRKSVDLGHLFDRLEPGLIEESRKITAD